MALFKMRRAMLAAKVETTEGTAITLASADVNLLTYDLSFESGIDLFRRTPNFVDMSPYSSVVGRQLARIRFKAEQKASGTAGTAPAVGRLLRACQTAETIVAVTSATYDPMTAASATLTIAAHSLPESGNTIAAQIHGARGNAKLVVKAGEPAFWEFEFLGVYSGVTDTTQLVPTALETTLPPAYLNATFTIQALAAKITGFTVDLGNTLQLRGDQSKATGYFSCLVTGVEPKLSFQCEKELVATHNFYGILLAATQGALTAAIGATAGNILTVTAPKVQYTAITEGENEGVQVYNVEALLLRSVATGNDHVKFAFT